MRYGRTDGVVKRVIAGEAFLVPVKKNLADMQNLFVLQGCGEFIWDCLGEAAGRDEVVGKVTAEFEVDSTEAGRDVDGFLKLLLSEGLASQQG